MQTGTDSINSQVQSDGPPTTSAWYRWYVLTIMLMVSIVSVADRFVVAVVAETLRHEFRLSDSEIGLLSGLAFSLTYALAVLPMGYLLDRYSRRRIMGIMVLVWSALTAACGLAQSFTGLLIARLGVGAAETSAAPGGLSWVGDTFPRNERSTAIGIFNCAGALGMMLCFVAGGWLLHSFGWRYLFFLAGIPGIILALLILFTLKEPVRGAYDDMEPVRPGDRITVSGALRTIITDRPLVLVGLGIAICAGTFTSLQTWMTSFMARVHDVPVAHAAAVSGMIIGICTTVGSVASGLIADKVTKGDVSRLCWVAAIGTMGSLASGLAFVGSSTARDAFICLGAMSAFNGSFIGISYSLLISRAQPHVRSFMLALSKLTTIFIGGGLIVYFTGVMSDYFGGDFSLRPALFVTMLFNLIATFCYMTAGAMIKKDSRSQLRPTAQAHL